MDNLHKSVYELSKAYASLVPTGGPVLCRDEMEEWSASEANLFEEALDKYGKDFNDIRQDFVSTKWKSNHWNSFICWNFCVKKFNSKVIKFYLLVE